jgi:single-strand DNA-binding protein
VPRNDCSNNCDLVGNLNRNPELRYPPGDQAVVNFGLAVTRRWQNRQTYEWEEPTTFFDVACWGQPAESVAESLTKGMRVILFVRLDQRSWQTEAGEKRSRVEVVADEVGPSLCFASAGLTKNERSTPTLAGVVRSSAVASPGPHTDEEPF